MTGDREITEDSFGASETDFAAKASGLALFKNIPFLNGGLFECLDKPLGEKGNPYYVRID